MLKPNWRSKYNARKTEMDGIVFDSIREAHRYAELKQLESAGEIIGLELQPKFPLVVNGERIAVYRADFRYCDSYGHIVVEDVKGFRTPVYKLKKKLFEAIYGMAITEIE